MKLKQIAFFETAILVACMLFSQAAFSLDDEMIAELPRDVKLDKMAFDTIPSVVQTYEKRNAENVTYFNRPNGDKWVQRIKFIDFGDDLAQIDGEKTFDLPAEIANITRFFSDLRLEGSIASEVQMELVNPNGKKCDWKILSGHYWGDEIKTTYTKTDWLTGKESGLLKPWTIQNKNGEPNLEGYQLIIKGKGTLKTIYLWEEKGVKPEYDLTAYKVLGGTKPWLENIKIEVDATTNLSINGENKLDEDKFKRYHVNSGPISLMHGDENPTTLDRAYHKIATEYGFLPGRGAVHFTFIEDNMGAHEDPNRPGYTDYTFLEDKLPANPKLAEKLDKLFPTVGDDYMLTTDGWPKWQKVDPENLTNRNVGAPALDKFDAAGELAGKYFEALHQRLDGRGPKYLEVKNESTISLEWPYMITEPEKGWQYLAEFHNVVSDQVKKIVPKTRVGGPSTAFMYLESNDFAEARNQLQFMDNTKGKLDFYTHHFYENGPTQVHDQDNNPSGFMAGRLEAVLGLLNNHMTLTDNVKPIYLTEIGTYNNGGGFFDYFKKLRTHNGYMLRFINSADSIGMLVPYLYPIINWNPTSYDTFYKYNSDQSDIDGTTPLIYHLDMWRDYRGAFIPANSSNDRVLVNAVRHGNVVHVAVQNMNTQRAFIDLNIDVGESKIVDVKRKHTFMELGKLVHELVAVKDLKRVPMRVEEMSIFEVTLDKSPEFKSTTSRITHYGDKLLQKFSNEPATFSIVANSGQPVKAVLRVCIGKCGSGFESPLNVTFNKQSFTRDLSYSNKQGNFWGFADFEIEPQLIQKTNVVSVSTADEGGFVSNVTLYNDYLNEKPKGVSMDSLTSRISNAEGAIKRISSKQNKNGNVDTLETAAVASYQFVIERALRVAKDPIATQNEVDRAIAELDTIEDALSK